MIKNTTLKDAQKLLSLPSSKLLTNTCLRPSRLTMKFVLGYAAALEILKTNVIGSVEVINN